MLLPPNQRCYLCGIQSPDTKDHLFPKNLFPRPLPSNLPPRLPCHKKCNNSLSKDEELFRVHVAGGKAYETTAGNRIWTERIRPSLRENRLGFKSLLKGLLTTWDLYSPGGLYLRTETGLKVDQNRFNRVLTKIAKGLYFLDVGAPLPSDILIRTEFDVDKMLHPPLDQAFAGGKLIDFGDGVVTYVRNTMEDDPTASMTWIRFYSNVTLFILTYHPSHLGITAVT